MSRVLLLAVIWHHIYRVNGRSYHAFRSGRDLQVLKTSRTSKFRRNTGARTGVVFYRILGNDLPGRHASGQTLLNLKRIIRHEQPFPSCEKRFILNRIVNISLESEIAAILETRKLHFHTIKFHFETYREILLDLECFPDPKHFLKASYYKAKNMSRRWRAIMTLYRNKNHYAMNNNGARNLALSEGKEVGEWILPWDGNCFMDRSAWSLLHRNMTFGKAKYLTVPMVRLAHFDPDMQILHRNIRWEEPQIAFHKTSEQTFDQAFQYGNMDKVELLQRLGTPGPWSTWGGDVAILKLTCFRQQNVAERQPKVRHDQTVGWVARLPSGRRAQEVGENSSLERARARQSGILQFLMDLDMKIEGHTFKDTIFIDERILVDERDLFRNGKDQNLVHKVKELIKAASEALDRGPFSVMDKKLIPPSGNKHDYFHCSPYSWPFVDKKNKTIFITKDGQRHPAAEMYSSESRNYDRTSLQRVFDDTTLAALAWYFTGNMSFAEHGAMLVDVFFLAEPTRMNPHMKFAQYSGKVSNFGIIEMKDIYYFLDSVRLLERSRSLSAMQISSFKKWLSSYSHWLQNSQLGLDEMLQENNHGIYYDLQLASIAAYLGNRLFIAESLARAMSRLPYHFTPGGVQVHEMGRPTSRHYCTFNIMAWINFAMFSRKFGFPLPQYRSFHGAGLVSAVELLLHQRSRWPYPDVGRFDTQRFEVVFLMSKGESVIVSSRGGKARLYSHKSLFHPHDAVRPFWNLGLKPLNWKNL